MSAGTARWISTITTALCAAMRRAESREEKTKMLDALEELTRLTGAIA